MQVYVKRLIATSAPIKRHGIKSHARNSTYSHMFSGFCRDITDKFAEVCVIGFAKVCELKAPMDLDVSYLGNTKNICAAVFAQCFKSCSLVSKPYVESCIQAIPYYDLHRM